MDISDGDSLISDEEVPSSQVSVTVRKTRRVPSPKVHSHEVFPVKALLEKRRGKYLVSWESGGTTWEPKSYVNSNLAKAFEAHHTGPVRPVAIAAFYALIWLLGKSVTTYGTSSDTREFLQ
ncbi:hypothetical protein Micbo1qcDRAFT_181301 [Microdochium bolleyi]|uniref:Chromo domain-containing protein n=1 Tax=Microdochium bolleyi TaxID=196109 RepID=A0A136IIT7_9PEZI|nr:hypothetical protein Micbo1qcDRAFT_181301 [Microdochium bolleyi]